jgi:hypothetical protein
MIVFLIFTLLLRPSYYNDGTLLPCRRSCSYEYYIIMIMIIVIIIILVDTEAHNAFTGPVPTYLKKLRNLVTMNLGKSF